MEDKIERINTYNDKRFDPEILKQHGAFLVNEKFVCQFQIFQRTCAVVTWEGNIDLEALIKEFRFYAEHVTKFYDKISLHIERRLKPHKYGIVEVVKSGKKQRNVGNSYFIPAPLLHHYSYT